MIKKQKHFNHLNAKLNLQASNKKDQDVPDVNILKSDDQLGYPFVITMPENDEKEESKTRWNRVLADKRRAVYQFHESTLKRPWPQYRTTRKFGVEKS